ncbi:hypothetical protein D3C87_1202680 [compost metagenome]
MTGAFEEGRQPGLHHLSGDSTAHGKRAQLNQVFSDADQMLRRFNVLALGEFNDTFHDPVY